MEFPISIRSSTCSSGQPDADGLRALFTTWITAPQPDLDVLVPAVLDGAINYLRSGASEFAAEAKTVLELGERYPGDAGVLASLLLNRITLRAGEGIYLPAGNLHAYLHGVGFEVMANSDNVLRGGLTPKHVDVPELLRVLDFTPASEATLRPKTSRRRNRNRSTTRLRLSSRCRCCGIDGDHLGHEVDAPSRHDGPQILLCTEGSVQVHAKSSVVTLERGAAAWVAADDGPIRLVAATPDQAVPRNRGYLTESSVATGSTAGDRCRPARQRGHRGREVRRLPDHRQFVDAGGGGALGGRHVNQGLLLLGQRQARKEADCAAPVRVRPQPLLLLVRGGAGAVHPRLGLRALRGLPEDLASGRS